MFCVGVGAGSVLAFDDRVGGRVGLVVDLVVNLVGLFRHIATGDAVRIHNDRGQMILEAKVAATIAPGVVNVPSTRWPKQAPDRANANSLTSQRLTDKGGGPCFYSVLVQIEKVGD